MAVGVGIFHRKRKMIFRAERLKTTKLIRSHPVPFSKGDNLPLRQAGGMHTFLKAKIKSKTYPNMAQAGG